MNRRTIEELEQDEREKLVVSGDPHNGLYLGDI